MEKYAAARGVQQKQIVQFTDSLTHIFAHDFLPLNVARSSALLALDFIPPLKHNLARRLMGMHGHLANLARGLPLE